MGPYKPYAQVAGPAVGMLTSFGAFAIVSHDALMWSIRTLLNFLTNDPQDKITGDITMEKITIILYWI